MFRVIIEAMKTMFIVDVNVGRLARRLRMMGYDTLFINGMDDDELVRMALKEERILLTKDTGILHRRIVATGKVKAILIESDDVREQLKQVVQTFKLDPNFGAFSLCMVCNTPLIPREKDGVRDLAPPYVFKTQDQYMQCPDCLRLYWRGTHWERMSEELEQLIT